MTRGMKCGLVADQVRIGHQRWGRSCRAAPPVLGKGLDGLEVAPHLKQMWMWLVSDLEPSMGTPRLVLKALKLWMSR